MANEQNLRPGEYKLSLDEQKKGGINSGISRRRKKLLKEQLDLLLSLDIKNQKSKEMLEQLGISPEDCDNQMLLNVALFNKALKGNVFAYQTIRDTLGEGIIDTTTDTTNTPEININIVDNSGLEKYMYERKEG